MKGAVRHPKWDFSLDEMSKRYKTDNVGDCYWAYFLEKYYVHAMTDDEIRETWDKEFNEHFELGPNECRKMRMETKEAISRYQSAYEKVDANPVLREMVKDLQMMVVAKVLAQAKASRVKAEVLWKNHIWDVACDQFDDSGDPLEAIIYDMGQDWHKLLSDYYKHLHFQTL
jgi:ribosomal protein S20